LNLVPAAAIIQWIFSQAQLYPHPFVWELLRNVIVRTLARVTLAIRMMRERGGMGDGDRKHELTAEAWMRERRDVFVLVCQLFADKLTSLSSSEQATATLQHAILEMRFRQFGRTFATELSEYVSAVDLDAVLAQADSHVRVLAESFKLLV